MHYALNDLLSPRRLWLWPRVALVLFVAAVLGLLAYLRHSEHEEARLTLISDVLWVEQNLRFQLQQSEERMAALLAYAGENPLDAAQFRTRARLLVAANPAIRAIRLDTPSQRYESGSTALAGELAAETRLARLSGRTTYTAPLDRRGTVAMVLADHDRRLLALVDLPALIAQQVPWWFATKYRLALLDEQGREIASKSSIAADDQSLSYQLAFDPVGHGLSLRITAYRAPTGVVQRLLIAAVIVLAVIVLLSWWRLRRQVQQRLSAEAALREEHAFRQSMEDSLSVGMRARDMEGRIVYVNPAFCRMVGYSSAELIGTRPPYPYWNPDDLAGHQAQNEAVLAGKAPVDGFESTIRHADGHLVATRVYTAPLIDATGKQSGWMSSVVDITAIKAAEAREREQEEKLRQTGRLVAMGEMASTLAHELNQPLMAMSSYASAARQFASQGDAVTLDTTLEKIAGQAQRAADVVRRIREFVRKHAPHRETCNLNAIAIDALELIDATAHNRGIRLNRDLAVDLPDIEADRVLLGQVVLNLLRNALDACAGRAASAREVQLSTRYDADTVQLSVQDNGPGISPEVAARLFEAFFSTKEFGMGIGLNICRSILEQHHGKLWFEAAPAGGAVFHLSLPRGDHA
ncbi:nitrogen regulation protein NR(II) [Chitinimonas sp. BJYL2]|uniref:two-component system sensor histidine kinase NtrB n=1 Tax=Chitinimonas sp. BJYL2 TaxID=2976696 RepID=UPI0022B5105D|nr:ATP-binding protein [Chitinimonas sp. BJYL2]